MRRHFHSKTYVNLYTPRVDLDLMSNGISSEFVLCAIKMIKNLYNFGF